MSIDAVIMNRILPDGINDAYFKDWIQGQQQRLEQAADFFKPNPIFI
jgi:anion-transporting  ArsA/GET3 family ATPase